MDFGIDTLVYIIIGVIFVVVQATRKRKVVKGNPPAEAQIVKNKKEEIKEELSAFWKEFLSTDLTANQVTEPVQIQPVPPVFTEPADFQRNNPAPEVPVAPRSSFNDPGDRAVSGLHKPAKLPDQEQSYPDFDLRSAVVYSVILERKYV
ncbi:MAG: hypothetical protein WC699_15690 [Bacteroidales bacterium]|jgi:hypothetical protein